MKIASLLHSTVALNALSIQERTNLLVETDRFLGTSARRKARREDRNDQRQSNTLGRKIIHVEKRFLLNGRLRSSTLQSKPVPAHSQSLNQTILHDSPSTGKSN